jgi:hypothetical protein
MSDHTLNIDTVAIIESLSAHEKKTGEMLFDHIQAQGRDAAYLPVETEAQFTSAIQEVERMCRSLGKRAALHFEIHGQEKGFRLSVGELVPWARVRQDIINLNFHLKNHLLVSMAVCRGTWLLSIMRATTISPFHSLVSSQRVIYEADIERGFPVFYDSLLAGDTLEKATSRLNLAQNGSHFDLITTEDMFAQVFQNYFSKYCNPQAMQLRAKNIRAKLTRLGVNDRELRHKLVQLYKTTVTKEQEPSFEDYRARFFMHDDYPENMAEFCPTYEDLIAGRPAAPTNPT